MLAAALLWGAYSLGHSQGTYELSDTNYSQGQAAASTAEINGECAGLGGPAHAKCADEIENARDQRERDQQNLNVQRKVADRTTWFILLGIIELALTSWGIFVLRDQLAATRDAIGKADESNTIARDSAHRQLRPYVYLTRVEMKLQNPIVAGMTIGDSAPIRLHFKNFGSTPAKHVSLRAKAFIGGIWNEPFDVSFDDCHPVYLGDMPPGFEKDRDGYTLLGVEEAYPNILFGVASAFVCGIIEYSEGDPKRPPYKSEFRLASTETEFAEEKFSPTLRGNESD